MALKTGDKAPDFERPAVTADGETTVRLADFQGRKLVLYFYPKDDTPGCTKEACSFRDMSAEFEKKNAAILGVSTDSPKSHGKFIGKYTLPFPLVSDEDRSMSEAYGVWNQKSLYGRIFFGIERTTFVIDENGMIERIYPKVKVSGHIEKVLADLG